MSLDVTILSDPRSLETDVVVFKSNSSVSSTASGVSFFPLIFMKIVAVEVWPASSVIVYVNSSMKEPPSGILFISILLVSIV